MNGERVVRETSPLADVGPAQKRRKLRKGTQSCWECKRRKARCTFSAATEDVCEGCKRRGTDCISQEFTDQPPPPGSNKHISDRLGQVEALVGQLLKAARHHDDGLLSPDTSETRTTNYSPTPSNPNVLPQNNSSSNGTGSRPRGSMPSATEPELPTAPEDLSTTETHEKILQKLLVAWPNQQDLNAIASMPIETSQVIRAVTCIKTNLSDSTLPSPKTLLQLPSAGSHPVLVARKLLLLAVFLQGIPISSASHLENLSTSYLLIMSRAVKTAHSLVTCNDELVASIEGIECILLESMYENYAGELRRSWLAARRAVTIAQILGLNRGVTPLSLTGSSAIEPEEMWFRLVQFDRYLSLMLGLPQSSLENGFARSDALHCCTAMERMLRLCCVACGRLLQRDPSEMYDPKVTKDIDKLLQDASAKMPPQWWLTPILLSHSSQVEQVRETLRFNHQFMHYHLLLQLHLPYLLRPNTEREYDYNRMTAIAASREILSRFRSFRTLQAAHYYCRGVDLVTFISSAALCLAHICDQQRRGTDGSASNLLTHQRLSDRGMLEQTLATMQDLVRHKGDAIATRVATLLQYLLRIEDDVASGGSYTVVFASESRKDDELGFRAKLVNEDSALNIYLPHFWVIKIERQDSQPMRLETAGSPKFPGENRIRAKSNRETVRDITRDAAHQSPSFADHASQSLDNGTACLQVPTLEAEEPPVLQQDGVADNWTLENLDFSFFDNFLAGTPHLDACSN